MLVGAYGSDAVRYYFAREVEFGRDGDFAEERFRAIVNADLANTFGNLLNRTLGLLKKNCCGVLPSDAASIPPDHPLRSFAAEQARSAQRWEVMVIEALLRMAWRRCRSTRPLMCGTRVLPQARVQAQALGLNGMLASQPQPCLSLGPSP